MADTDEIKAQLLREYSSTLDESTFLAIISDFDLTNGPQLHEARRTLNILKESAEAENNSTFDASGSSRLGIPANGSENGHGDYDNARSLRECSRNTDDTSLSQGFSSLGLEGYSKTDGNTEDKSYIGGLEGLDEEGKVSILTGIFSSLKVFDVKWTLKKCNWDVNRAIDDLMTESFLEESGGRHRGIEAFSESDLTLRPRKAKGKKRKDRVSKSEVNGPASESSVGSSIASKWDNGKQDVEFISTRTGVPAHQVYSIYHNNGASVRATISAIVDAHIALKLGIDDPIIQAKTIDLAHEFPFVPSSKLEAIIQITQPSDTFAHDLAKALVPPISNKSNLQIDFRHASLQLLDSEPTSSKPKNYDAVNVDDVSLEVSTAKVAKYTQARDNAFQKASTLYRKGKSDHLMGGAAAYYSQQARDADALARRAQGEAADARVNAQSTKFKLDLHGCNVNDAKRITMERVTAWWHELGQERGDGVKGGTNSHLKVVTGRGNHSEGGAGKLGPAIGKMLIRDGWKIEVTPGFLMITGLAHRK